MRECQDLLSIFFIPNQLPTTKDNSVKPLLNNGFSIFANRGTKIMPNDLWHNQGDFRGF